MTETTTPDRQTLDTILCHILASEPVDTKLIQTGITKKHGIKLSKETVVEAFSTLQQQQKIVVYTKEMKNKLGYDFTAQFARIHRKGTDDE